MDISKTRKKQVLFVEGLIFRALQTFFFKNLNPIRSLFFFGNAHVPLSFLCLNKNLVCFVLGSVSHVGSAFATTLWLQWKEPRGVDHRPISQENPEKSQSLGNLRGRRKPAGNSRGLKGVVLRDSWVFFGRSGVGEFLTWRWGLRLFQISSDPRKSFFEKSWKSQEKTHQKRVIFCCPQIILKPKKMGPRRIRTNLLKNLTSETWPFNFVDCFFFFLGGHLTLKGYGNADFFALSSWRVRNVEKVEVVAIFCFRFRFQLRRFGDDFFGCIFGGVCRDFGCFLSFFPSQWLDGRELTFSRETSLHLSTWKFVHHFCIRCISDRKNRRKSCNARLILTIREFTRRAPSSKNAKTKKYVNAIADLC